MNVPVLDVSTDTLKVQGGMVIAASYAGRAQTQGTHISAVGAGRRNVRVWSRAMMGVSIYLLHLGYGIDATAT